MRCFCVDTHCIPVLKAVHGDAEGSISCYAATAWCYSMVVVRVYAHALGDVCVRTGLLCMSIFIHALENTQKASCCMHKLSVAGTLVFYKGQSNLAVRAVCRLFDIWHMRVSMLRSAGSLPAGCLLLSCSGVGFSWLVKLCHRRMQFS